MADQTTHIFLNPVPKERAADFEEFIRTVLLPASREHRPQWEGRSEDLRAMEEEDGVITFAFILRGGAREDWDLAPLFVQAYGAEEGKRLLTRLEEMVPTGQYGWSFRPMDSQ